MLLAWSRRSASRLSLRPWPALGTHHHYAWPHVLIGWAGPLAFRRLLRTEGPTTVSEQTLEHRLQAQFDAALAAGNPLKAYNTFHELSQQGTMFARLTETQIASLFALINEHLDQITDLRAVGRQLISGFEKLYTYHPLATANHYYYGTESQRVHTAPLPLEYLNQKIRYYVACGRYILVRDTLNYIQTMGIRPSPATFNYALHIPGMRNWRFTLDLYQRFKAVQHHEAASVANLLAAGLIPLQLGLDTYHVLYGSAINNALQGQADYMWRELDTNHGGYFTPRTCHYRALHLALDASPDSISAAWSYLKQLVGLGIVPLNATFAQLLARAMVLNVHDCMAVVDGCWQTLRSRHSRLSAALCAQLIRYYMRFDQTVAAVQVLHYFEQFYLDRSNTLLHHLIPSLPENEATVKHHAHLLPELGLAKPAPPQAMDVYSALLDRLVDKQLYHLCPELLDHVDRLMAEGTLLASSEWFVHWIRYLGSTRNRDLLEQLVLEDLGHKYHVPIVPAIANVLILTYLHLGDLGMALQWFDWFLTNDQSPPRKTTHALVQRVLQQSEATMANGANAFQNPTDLSPSEPVLQALHLIDHAIAKGCDVLPETFGLVDRTIDSSVPA
ncbi:hypothetical protein H4R34_001546 [Dimargaris verticillata]|uniref:Uncharacterized protein n=1 Tax=Dimargaris verticillata TaxID=2761393 RepID=A0A9W8EA69_9FUNG|nr:hypothetical protein H4R34_001546 [Dimargaris verticillata]